MSIGLTALMCGITVFLVVWAVLQPREELPPNPGAGFLDDMSAPAVTRKTGFERYVRPVLRNFMPQTPMTARVKARGNNKIVELLVHSGNPWNLQPEEYVALQWLFAISGFFVGLLLGLAKIIPVIPVSGMVAIGVLGGYFLPKVIHDSARGKRRKAATKGLPEALDLLVITLTSGLNFEPALEKVVERMPDGLIREELGRVSQDLRAGKSLTRALTDFARRSPSETVDSFCNSVIQAQRLGSDISDTLEAQSAAARASYEATLDERIGKLPTTLFFPILGLALPALFIVILAPAFSNISANF